MVVDGGDAELDGTEPTSGAERCGDGWLEAAGVDARSGSPHKGKPRVSQRPDDVDERLDGLVPARRAGVAEQGIGADDDGAPHGLVAIGRVGQHVANGIASLRQHRDHPRRRGSGRGEPHIQNIQLVIGAHEGRGRQGLDDELHARSPTSDGACCTPKRRHIALLIHSITNRQHGTTSAGLNRPVPDPPFSPGRSCTEAEIWRCHAVPAHRSPTALVGLGEIYTYTGPQIPLGQTSGPRGATVGIGSGEAPRGVKTALAATMPETTAPSMSATGASTLTQSPAKSRPGTDVTVLGRRA